MMMMNVISLSVNEGVHCTSVNEAVQIVLQNIVRVGNNETSAAAAAAPPAPSLWQIYWNSQIQKYKNTKIQNIEI